MANWWDDLPEAQTPPAPDSQAPAGNWWDNLPTTNEKPPPPDFVPQRGDSLLPTAPYDATDMAVHGMTFGLADPLRAAMHAGTDWAATKLGLNEPGTQTPTDRGFDFSRRWDEVAAGRRQYEAEHPWLSTAADLAGSLAYAPGRAASAAVAPLWSRLFGPTVGEVSTTAANPSLWKEVATSTGVGTTGAALTGAADNPEAPLAGAVSYAPGGAIGGAVAPIIARTVGSIGRGVSNLIWPEANAQQNAVNTLRSLTAQDTSVGHPDLGALDQRLLGSDAPLTLADVSPGVRAYVGSLFDRNTPAATQIGSTLERRDAGAQGRLLTGFDRTVGTGPETFQAEEALHAQQKANAKPAYDNAYMQAPINPDLVAPGGALHALINTPAGKQAMNNATKIAAQERVSPQSLGITFNEAGDPVFQGVPSWQTLDYVKRGMDDVLNGYPRDPFTGKRQLDTYGHAVAGTLGEYRDLLTRENPAYGSALQVFSGDQAARNALEAGSHALAPGMSAAEHLHIFDQLSPGDQDLYRLGAANALRLNIRGTPDLGDETKRIANSTEMRDKLRPLFGSNDDYTKFVDGAVKDERTIFNTNYSIAGGSPSARRLGAMGKDDSGMGAATAPMAAAGALMGGAGLGKAAMAGGGAALMGPTKDWLNRMSQRLAGQSPQAQSIAADLALAPNPAARQVLGLLMAPQNRPLAPSWLPGTLGATSLTSTVPSLLESAAMSPY